MGKPLHVLIVEDSEDDSSLLIRQLRGGGYGPIYKLVETAEAMSEALSQREWDVVISDYVLPEFSGLEVLKLLQSRKLDIPCIIVSGKITDEIAVGAMKAGARDYVMKDNLKRISQVIERELAEAKTRRERALAQERLLWQGKVLDEIGEAVIVTDLQGEITYWNDAAEKTYGWKRDEILGHNVIDIAIPGPSQKGFTQILGKIVLKESWTGEYLVLNKSGKLFTVLFHLSPLLSENGEVTGIIGISDDITDRKLAEKELRESNEFNASMMRNAPNPIIVFNRDKTIRYINPALEKLTGYLGRELVGKGLPLPWWPVEQRDAFEVQFNKIFDKLTRWAERCFVKKNGEIFWIDLTSIPVKDNNGRLLYVLGSWIDITERKYLNEQMEYYARKVTEAQEQERSRIARELHDDTAQSLAILSLDLDSILRHSGLPEDIARRLRQMKDNTNRALEEVRRFSHELRPGILDHLGVIAAIDHLIEENNIGSCPKAEFEVTGDERRLPPEVELALFRIAQESLNNVRKHSQATLASVEMNFTADCVRLIISDNGKGFSKRVESKAIQQGHLGLTGMKERAGLIGADLKLKSRPGKGTTVTVEVATHS